MKLRLALRLSLTAFTATAAVASVASGSLWVAGSMAVCAVIVAVAPMAVEVSRDDIKTLLESLRVSEQAGAPEANAVVTSALIFIGRSKISGTSGHRSILLFRDEIEAPVWRQMATLLRHQAHPSLELKKAGQSAALRLGK